MNEIITNKLYLGDMFDANDDLQLKANNITCVICVAERVKINNPNIPRIQKNGRF